MLYDRILKEKSTIENELKSIEEQLSQLPDGNLICARNGQYYKWYQSSNNSCQYIPKKNQHLAEQLAAKKYLTACREDLLHEQKALDAYLKKHQVYTPQVPRVLESSSEVQRLLAPYFTPLSQELSDWMTFPYEQNPKYPDGKTIKTLSGHMVRSKSEAMIAMALYIHNIPFRYEYPLHLDLYTVFYPDFTIRHPETGEFYYYEHFGMMDDPKYAQNAFSKLQVYNSCGIIPSINLITTFETKDHPLDTQTINQIIENYFL